MTRNLKALGLALLAICALGAVAAQGASAATAHEFHAAEEKVIATGTNKEEEPKALHTFKVGMVGTVACNKVETESTQTGTLVSANTYKAHYVEEEKIKFGKIVVTPRYEECTFGGQPATVKFNHCYYEFDSDTTFGNKTNEAAEHANVDIKCEGEPAKIEIHTSLCTITVKPQLVKHAVRYKNIVGASGKKAVTVESTGEKIVVDKSRTTESQPVNGCLTFPVNGSAVGTYTGNVKTECFKDETVSPPTGTNKTTPKGLTTEGAAVDCTVSPGA